MSPSAALAELQKICNMPAPQEAIWDALPARIRDVIVRLVRPGGIQGLTTGKAAELSAAELTLCWSMLRELATHTASAVRQLDITYERHAQLLQAAHPEPVRGAA